MLLLDVPPYVAYLPTSVGTVGAGVGLLPGVHHVVDPKIFAGMELLATLRTPEFHVGQNSIPNIKKLVKGHHPATRGGCGLLLG